MQVTVRHTKERARDYALRILKDNIISMNLEPGSSISENELAAELGVSRTPIREALMELSKAQIVEIYPQKGSSIALIDNELVQEAGFLRLVLETAIVEQVCDVATSEDILKLEENVQLQEFYLQNESPNKLLQLDDKFHEQLFRICRKQRIYNMMKSFTIHFDRVRNLSLSTVTDIHIVSDHKDIVDSIRNRDREAAVATIKKHLSRHKFDEKLIREKHPKYFK